jgi:6-phosphogluconolactonase
VADAETVARVAAQAVVDAAREATAARGRFLLALSGGATPRALYRRLAGTETHGEARPAVDWGAVHVFWGDERMVPPTHPDSNYRMAREALLDHVPIPSPQIHPIPTEGGEPDDAARRYEDTLLAIAGRGPESPPALDLVLLGLGEDAHTASIFPGSPLLDERTRFVGAAWVERLDAWRVSLTVPAIAAARAVLFVVSGAAKAGAVAAVLAREPRHDLPARRVVDRARAVRWILDADAAAALDRSA